MQHDAHETIDPDHFHEVRLARAALTNSSHSLG